MTTKRTILTAGLALALLPATAQAAITTSYCNASLRGRTALAPDNDIKAYVKVLQDQGYDVVGSTWYGYYRRGAYDLELDYKFDLASGYYKLRTFRCRRDGGKASGTYRDWRV